MVECKVCGKECKNIKSLSIHLRNNYRKNGHPIDVDLYYWIYLRKNEEDGICQYCKIRKTKLISLTLGYSKFCCKECSDKGKNYSNGRPLKLPIILNYNSENNRDDDLENIVMLPHGQSYLEKEILDEIKELLFNKFNKQFKISENNRYMIAPLEIDILIPELKLSIEVNGDYWQSLPGAVERDQKKCKLIPGMGFKHFIIKEYEWNDDKQFVLNKLNTLLEMDFETYSENIFYFTGFQPELEEETPNEEK
jgi:very-short-patch-repair endonuclease